MNRRREAPHKDERMNAIKPWQSVADKFAGLSARSLGQDMLAGLTLWGVLVPEGLAYAGMAGMPVQAGLYTLLASLPLYFLFGKSPVLVCAGTSSESILMAVIVAPLAMADPARYGALSVLLVLVTGLIFFAAGAGRFGRVSSFLSKPVMTGFIFGLAIYIAISQLHKVLGVPRGHGSTVLQFMHLAANPDRINIASAFIGGSALAVIFALERYAPRLPASLCIMALGIATARLFGLGSGHHVATVHSFPAGLPSLVLPSLNLADLESLVAPAIGLALVAFSQALGAVQSRAGKAGEPVDPDRELKALGLANIGASLLGGILAGGSMSSTAVNVSAGAKSQFSTLTTWVMVALTLCFFTPVLQGLPEAILGAVVIHAVVRLMKVSELKRYYALNRNEFTLSLIALFGVVVFNVLPGLVIALAASLIRLIMYASNVSVAVLGEVNDRAPLWVDSSRHPGAREVPGVRILRVDRPLFFANAEGVRARILELLDETSGVRAIALHLRANMRLCVTGADMLRALAEELRGRSVRLAFIEPAPDVLDVLRKNGILAVSGEQHVYPSIGLAAKALGELA
jgi:sulfate permease, SulP family